MSSMKERKKFEFEVCTNSVESCIAAQRAGADRVELCMGIPEGGTTPSYGELQMARNLLKETRLHVIIRNRGGDFLYAPQELERGVVFGCLTPEGDIDKAANTFLLEHAKGMSVTFHRAFDRCRDPKEALKEIIALGFDRVLTSGQQPTAEQGIPLLRQLHVLADNRIILMAGCGVNESNIARIHKETGVHAFHFSAREPKHSLMTYANPAVFMGKPGTDEDTILITTERRVRNTIDALLNG